MLCDLFGSTSSFASHWQIGVFGLLSKLGSKGLNVIGFRDSVPSRDRFSNMRETRWAVKRLLQNQEIVGSIARDYKIHTTMR